MARTDERGAVFIFSLVICGFFMAIAATWLLRGVHDVQLSERSGNQSLALHMADAGIDQAARNLRTNNAQDDLTTRSFGGGTFNLGAVTELSPTMRRVTSSGLGENEQRQVEAVIGLTPQSVFQFALFGDQKVEIGGEAITDSYDSREGAYQPDPAAPGYNFGKDGDVGTNATASTATTGITVSGSSLVVNGQVIVGPDVVDPHTVVTGNTNDDFITGGPPKYVSEPYPFPMDPVTAPAGCETTLPPLTDDPGNPGGKIRLFTTAVGTYCPGGDLTINGNEHATADGPVKIYLSGELKINGNALVGEESHPSWMTFLGTSTSSATINLTEGSIEGSTKVHAALYAPEATIDIGGDAEIFGAIVAKNVNLSGDAQIHYDLALGEYNAVSNHNRTRILSWREP